MANQNNETMRRKFQQRTLEDIIDRDTETVNWSIIFLKEDMKNTNNVQHLISEFEKHSRLLKNQENRFLNKFSLFRTRSARNLSNKMTELLQVFAPIYRKKRNEYVNENGVFYS